MAIQNRGNDGNIAFHFHGSFIFSSLLFSVTLNSYLSLILSIPLILFLLLSALCVPSAVSLSLSRSFSLALGFRVCIMSALAKPSLFTISNDIFSLLFHILCVPFQSILFGPRDHSGIVCFLLLRRYMRMSVVIILLHYSVSLDFRCCHFFNMIHCHLGR